MNFIQIYHHLSIILDFTPWVKKWSFTLQSYTNRETHPLINYADEFYLI